MDTWTSILQLAIGHTYFPSAAGGQFVVRPSVTGTALLKGLDLLGRPGLDSYQVFSGNPGLLAGWLANASAPPLTLLLHALSTDCLNYSDLDGGPPPPGAAGVYYLSNRASSGGGTKVDGMTLTMPDGTSLSAKYLPVTPPGAAGATDQAATVRKGRKRLSYFTSAEVIRTRPLAVIQLFPTDDLGDPVFPAGTDPGTPARVKVEILAREIQWRYQVTNESGHFDLSTLTLKATGANPKPRATAAATLVTPDKQPTEPGAVLDLTTNSPFPLSLAGPPLFSLWSGQQQLMDLPLPSPSALIPNGPSAITYVFI